MNSIDRWTVFALRLVATALAAYGAGNLVNGDPLMAAAIVPPACFLLLLAMVPR